jgi:hypothetical protein
LPANIDYDHIDRSLNIMPGSAYAQPGAAFNLSHQYEPASNPAHRAWIDDEDNV